jgi:TRAP-type mannitol/chloroaromatic compound transport system permease small subunit
MTRPGTAAPAAFGVRLILAIDRISALSGKAFAWLIGALMVVVCAEVVKRYALNLPSAWAFDVTAMMYGACFMMCGAYTLAQNRHVRGDFLYGSMRPRTQAALDLALYLAFFLPGILALVFAGWEFARDSWAIREHTSTTAEGPPLYPLKMLIPIAGALVLLQGGAEITRCILCLRTGQWPERLKDVEETDVVEQQLAASTHVDAEAKRLAIENIEAIDAAAHHRATAAGEAK